MSDADFGIVHLGLGAFARAFCVPWIEDAMRVSGGEWGVMGVSLRSPKVRNDLAENGFSYHTLERGADGAKLRKINALRGVMVAPEDAEAVVQAMARPEVKIVSLTVTEKGYCYDPASGGLDRGMAIINELANPESPETAPGFIVAALAQRRAAGIAPFTCLSCDNLPGNGAVLRKVVLDLAGMIDPGLAEWIAELGCFPSTMVDRIVPATTSDDLAEVEHLAGAPDPGAVVHEPFRQWVIEDRFVDDARPDLGAVGVQLVNDVAPFEHMKLRCLNGTHSAMAYLGVLAGFGTVAEAANDPDMRRFIETLWQREVLPSFQVPDGADGGDYTRALMRRYLNPAIRHKTIQIAMDGSQKLPQRILATMADNLAAGHPVDGLALVVAAWIRFLGGVDDAGDTIAVNDPMADELQLLARSADPVASVTGVAEVFAPELASDARFRDPVQSAFDALAAKGVRAVLKEL